MKERYAKEIAPALKKSLDLENVMQVPHIKKVVVNIGVGEALDNAKALDAAVGDMTTITGQKPVSPKRARASPISSCAKAVRSVSRSPCVANGCGLSWTA